MFQPKDRPHGIINEIGNGGEKGSKSLSIWSFLIAEKLASSFAQRRIVVGSRKTMNLLLTIVFGVVGLVLSYGFFIPPELSMFRLIALIGMMVGYRVGQLVSRLVRPRPKRFLLLSVGAVLCLYFALAYVGMIQMGSANTSDIVNLGALLGLFFLSLGFLLPFTRVLVPSERQRS
jgi:drug/metabolite transporter (DMT)-like permease